MHTVSSDIDIDLPVRTVYNQWTQFEDFPAFMGGVEEVKQVDETTLNWRVTVGGVERDFLAKITEQVPDERVAWNSVSGPSHAGVVTFHRLDENKTRVRLQLDWEPEGFVEHAGALLQLDDAQVAKDLKEFARLLESNGFESGAWRGSVDRPSDGTAV
ncbi:SRPBCC family protein [Leucobacter chromiiresistens]|uniref:Cyclase n=1 Tax=Leucobacter chromiiresistens TaxID=1079994 RepID=A0A147ES82_9MICO|nr:SRPBCC family protein [Leucobacter chromiiresistens]KTR87321.1 cyclase [Leucobacter chromiiresistens]